MSHAKQIFDQLMALQHPITEDDLVDSILDGLDSAFRPLVRNILTSHNSIAFDDLFGMLLSKEMQLKSDSSLTPTETPTTLYSSRSQGRRRGCGNYFSHGQGRNGRGSSAFLPFNYSQSSRINQ